LAGASLTAQPDLDHRGHPGHLGCSAHWATEAFLNTVPFIDPIQMRINLNDAQIFEIFIGL
jgi:hypothetical protein